MRIQWVLAGLLAVNLLACSRDRSTQARAPSSPSRSTPSAQLGRSGGASSAARAASAPARPAAAPSAESPAPARHSEAALDWDGARWDAGNVVGFAREGDRVVLTFDRYALYQDGALREGRSLVREPLVFGNTDMPYTNQNPKLRRYVLARGAEVVEVSNTGEECGATINDRDSPEPRFAPLDLEALLRASKRGDVSARGLGDARQDALTFNAEGEVIRVVFSAGC